MSLSIHQIRTVKKAFKSALRILFRPEPMTAVEHADKYFYMSPESSYIEGEWTTVGYQVAILNAIGNDEVQEVAFPKAARTGWTKILCAATNYFIDHKQRNIGIWQPNDTMRDRFSKKHIDTMIRDVKRLRDLFPWWGKKHKNNTKGNKSFLNFCELFLLGAEAANNFRELSLDVAMTDESGSYKMDVGDEGDALGLIEKRLEGSAFSKFVNGSSPTIAGKCLITKRAEHCEQHFYRYIPCPRCGDFQILEFGGKDTKHGLKWDRTLTGSARNKSAHYVCKHCHDKFQYVEYLDADKLGYYESTQGILTFDGIEYFDAKTRQRVETPETIAFMGIWTIYSHFAPWWKIVRDWYQDKGTPAGLKKFTNTTLGQPWEEETGEKTTAETLMLRREMYKAQVPKNAYYLTCGLDMQDTWVPGTVYGWGLEGERFKVDKFEVRGNPKDPEFWDELEKACNREYTHESGVTLKISKFCFDTGGHFTDQVHAFSRRLGITRMLPCKGASTYGKPIATMPKKPDHSRKTYLVSVGTDTAKTSIFSSLKIQPDSSMDRIAGCFHLPLNDQICNEEMLNELCSESKRREFIKGRAVYRWLPLRDGIRNEELDCAVYAEAAFYCAVQYFGLNMQQLAASFKNIDLSAKSALKKKKKKRGTVTGGIT
jgi:phage terminase large subunit GpA-like protein